MAASLGIVDQRSRLREINKQHEEEMVKQTVLSVFSFVNLRDGRTKKRNQSYSVLSYLTLSSWFFHVAHSTAVIIGIKKSAVLRASSLYACRQQQRQYLTATSATKLDVQSS